MRRTTIRAALLLAALLLLAPASAGAAPNRSTTLAAVGDQYTWDGGPISGATATSDIFQAVGCQPGVTECDDTLVQVGTRSVLTAKTSDASAGATDLDLYLYASDASGTAGMALKSSAGPDANETVSAPVNPGYYLVRVASATSTMGTFKGLARLDAAPAVATDDGSAVGGGAQPAPTDPGAAPPGSSQSTTGANTPPNSYVASPRPGTKKTIRAITGTTSDDGDVASVAAGLVRIVSGHDCRALIAKGLFAKISKCTAPPLLKATGTVSWKLTLRRKLPPGRYVVYARATDTAGAVEGGFGRENAVRFTVKR